MDSKIEINADELPTIRERLMKCKVVVLSEMDKHPLVNTTYFSKPEKDDLLKRVRSKFDTISDEALNEAFNRICCDRLFDPKADFSNYPVYVDSRFPAQQKKIDDEEPAFQQLKEDIKTNKLIVQDIAGNLIEVEGKEEQKTEN